MKVLPKPRKRPKTILQSSDDKYLSPKIHDFRAKYISSFRNFAPLVLGTLNFPGDHISHNSLNIYIYIYIYKKPPKIIKEKTIVPL